MVVVCLGYGVFILCQDIPYLVRGGLNVKIIWQSIVAGVVCLCVYYL